MNRKPTDADGVVVPTAQPDAAWEAASGLASVARSAQAALDVLGPGAGAICWQGEAADGYRRVRGRLASRTAQVAELASAGAGIVLDWLRSAAPALTAMRSVATQIADLQRRVEAAAAVAYDPALDTRLQAELDDAYRRWHAALDTYWDAVDVAARRLVAVRDVVTDRPLDGQDQVEGAMKAAWQGYVAGPATAAWALTGLALTDPDSWWHNVSGVPGAAAGTVGMLAAHPEEAAASAVRWEDWRAGRYGTAAGALSVTFIPGPRWLTFGKDVGRARFAANLAPRHAPRPVLQSVDEMLTDGVDLARHEHFEYGHTLRRHLFVSDDFQMDRLTYGTLEDSGRRGQVPVSASRFTDLATAESSVTEALRRNVDAVLTAEHLPVGEELWIRYEAPHPVGEVMRRAPGGFVVREASTVHISLVRGEDGVYVNTAFIEE